MDDIVRQAIAKWPNVPHCYGWLGLDARGQWYMRDDRTQAAGPFPQAKGSLLRHEKQKSDPAAMGDLSDEVTLKLKAKLEQKRSFNDPRATKRPPQQPQGGV